MTVLKTLVLLCGFYCIFRKIKELKRSTVKEKIIFDGDNSQPTPGMLWLLVLQKGNRPANGQPLTHDSSIITNRVL